MCDADQKKVEIRALSTLEKKITHYSGHYRYPRLDRSFSPNPAGSKDRLFSLDTADDGISWEWVR